MCRQIIKITQFTCPTKHHPRKHGPVFIVTGGGGWKVTRRCWGRTYRWSTWSCSGYDLTISYSVADLVHVHKKQSGINKGTNSRTHANLTCMHNKLRHTNIFSQVQLLAQTRDVSFLLIFTHCHTHSNSHQIITLILFFPSQIYSGLCHSYFSHAVISSHSFPCKHNFCIPLHYTFIFLYTQSHTQICSQTHFLLYIYMNCFLFLYFSQTFFYSFLIIINVITDIQTCARARTHSSHSYLHVHTYHFI